MHQAKRKQFCLWPVLLLGASVFPNCASVNAQVTTAQYGNARLGSTLVETVLTPANVNSETFAKLFTLPVDGDVYAQPLYLPQLEIPGKGKRDVLFVATEHDSIYAFDAGANPPAVLWQTNFLDHDKGVITVPPSDLSCPFIRPEVGITPTPVIDQSTGTMYVLARTKERKEYVQRLHALAVTTGRERPGSPIVIQATFDRAAQDGTRTTVAFDPLRQNARAALLLAADKVYLTWASSCDVAPYHGWVMAYDARTLKQVAVLNTSIDAGESGIWQGDAGPAADEMGNVYVVTGNGKFDADSGGHDYGDSVLKLAVEVGSFAIKDYFTPFNQHELNEKDLDLGSSGPVLLPDQGGPHPHLLLTAGKGEGIYVLDRDQLGKYRSANNGHAFQTIPSVSDCFGAPAYWNGHVYYACEDDSLKDFRVQGGRVAPESVAHTEIKFTGVGATPSISANAAKDGIVWIIATPNFFTKDAPAVLHAYDATNIAHELYNSEQKPTRDRAGTAIRFLMPTVANGCVYVGLKKEVDVYGLLPKSSVAQN